MTREWVRSVFDREVERLATRPDEEHARDLLRASERGLLDSTLWPITKTTPSIIVAEARIIMEEADAAMERLRAAQKARREKAAFDLSGVKAIAERGELPR